MDFIIEVKVLDGENSKIFPMLHVGRTEKDASVYYWIKNLLKYSL